MLSSRHPPSSASGAATTPPQPTSSWLSRLPLPFDALLACASVAAGLALFCCFSFKGMRAYEQTARHMRYQDDPVLKALLLAHKIAIAFAAILTFTALLAAALARAHARSAKEGWRANEEKAATTTTAASAAAPPPPSHLSSSSIAAARAVQGQGAPNSTASPNPITATIVARRRLVAACFAAIFAAAAFSVIVACASASGWAVGHMVQLGIESTASGDNRDFANAVGEALAQAQTKLARRMERSTNEAYSTVVNGALGDLLKTPVGAFRDTIVKQAVKLANETANAAAARAKATAGAPPPPRPPSCADKYCIYLALRPMFEEGEGLCICTFSYLAPAAAAARVGRGAMLFALLGALMMAAGFGALSQRASYWLGVTAPAGERARVAAGLFGGKGLDDDADGDEEGALRPKARRLLMSSGPKAATAAAANAIHVSASAEGEQQQQQHHHAAPTAQRSQPPARRTGSGGRVRSFFTGLSTSLPRRG